MPITYAARSYADDKLSSRRLESLALADRRRKEVYSKCPEIESLNQQISSAGIAAAMARLAGSDADPGKSIKQLTARMENLLSAAGYPANYLTDVFVCPACRDTGFLPNGTMCQCYKAVLNRYYQDRINAFSPLALCSFESFSLSYYPADYNPEYGCSPRENMARVLERCQEYSNSFSSRSGNLLMTGDAGLGKTHLALAISGKVIDKGHNVIYCSAPNIFRKIETEYFDEGHSSETLDSLKNCDLLVLDDLGAEYVNAHLASVVYDLLNSRICRSLPSIFTTNLTEESLIAVRYGEKVSSRLIGCCELLAFFGDDIRIKLAGNE